MKAIRCTFSLFVLLGGHLLKAVEPAKSRTKRAGVTVQHLIKKHLGGLGGEDRLQMV